MVCLTVGWPWSAAKTPASHYLLPCQWDGREYWKGKSKKIQENWDNDSLIGEVKLCIEAEQNKEFIHHFPPAGRCPASCWQGHSMCNHYLGRHMLWLYMLPHLLPFTKLLWLSAMSCGMEVIWYLSVWVSCPGCVPWQLLQHFQLTCWGGIVGRGRGK